MDTDRPTLTPDDCHALREFSGMTWCVRGRWVSMGEILDSWVDATMRAQYSASARAEALAARVAELEAELSATERTADEERERAKRAERLLESESALVAELEASVTYEHNRFKARGGELDRLDARVAELERSLSSTETHRQALARELGEIQQWRESEAKAAKRMAERLQALEAENERLKAWVKATNPWGGECEEPAPDNADSAPTTRSGTGELLAEGRDYQIRTVGTVPEPPSPAPTTRPLTTADRPEVQIGDTLRIHGGKIASVEAIQSIGRADYRALLKYDGGMGLTWVRIVVEEDGEPLLAASMPYLSRADGGLVTVKVTP